MQSNAKPAQQLTQTSSTLSLLLNLAAKQFPTLVKPLVVCPFFALQLTVPELEWQANTNKLALQFMAGGARAVYQAQLPLQLVANLDLGCVASVTPAVRNRPLGQGFSLGELQVSKALQRYTPCLYYG